MTESDHNAYLTALESAQSVLESHSRNRSALTIEANSDEGDRTQDSRQRDFAIGTFDRDATMLQKVRAALARLQDGSFGICQVCDESISPKRLTAVQWTFSCIVCQRASDLLAGQPWLSGADAARSAL